MNGDVTDRGLTWKRFMLACDKNNKAAEDPNIKLLRIAQHKTLNAQWRRDAENATYIAPSPLIVPKQPAPTLRTKGI
jgi:hypothetical protein